MKYVYLLLAAIFITLLTRNIGMKLLL